MFRKIPKFKRIKISVSLKKIHKEFSIKCLGYVQKDFERNTKSQVQNFQEQEESRKIPQGIRDKLFKQDLKFCKKSPDQGHEEVMENSRYEEELNLQNNSIQNTGFGRCKRPNICVRNPRCMAWKNNYKFHRESFDFKFWRRLDKTCKKITIWGPRWKNISKLSFWESHEKCLSKIVDLRTWKSHENFCQYSRT